jgi:Xaa-Pro dipeptidase
MTIEPGMPSRSFLDSEFEHRVNRTQQYLQANELDALLVTSSDNLYYYTGFLTQFLVSPSRPWFVVVPREGEPSAIIPEVGKDGMSRTWMKNIKTWLAPQPKDDGVSLLASVLSEVPRKFGRIGIEKGRETYFRMPLEDFERVRDLVPGVEFVNGTPTLWSVRMVKSPAEVDCIRYICQVVSSAFEELPNLLRIGDTEHDACRKLKTEINLRGADSTPFMPGISGPGGYDQVLVGPTERVLGDGDILFIDTGSTFNGYYCDFDRNFAFGHITDEAKKAHEAAWNATEAGIAASRPGATTTDLFNVISKILDESGSVGNNIGRMGHGLGFHLTEPPSHMPGDNTELVPGMVITIEPAIEYAPGKMLVHEENIVITEGEPEVLSRRAPREMSIITR